MDNETKAPQSLSDHARRVLNAHGHPFATAVLKEVERLNDARVSIWYRDVAEFPVQVNGHDTHIDFILGAASGAYQMVGECKRFGGQWLFARTPYARRGHIFDHFTVECCWLKNGWHNAPIAFKQLLPKESFNLSFELDAGERLQDAGRSSIGTACTQVMRGVNGLVTYLHDRTALIGEELKPKVLFPVIFTTAKLWVTDAKLEDSSLEDGKLSPDDLNLREVDWLHFQYHQSRSLRHAVGTSADQSTLIETIQSEFVRTILIVKALKMETFFPALASETAFLPPTFSTVMSR